MKTTKLILALIAVTATAFGIQRRDQVEFDYGEVNKLGELTYAVTEGSDMATLTVGTRHGNMAISDAFAIHATPNRLLLPSEYYVTTGSASYSAEGVYWLIPAGTTTKDFEGSVTIQCLNSAIDIDNVTFDVVQNSECTASKRFDKEKAYITARYQPTPTPGATPTGAFAIKNIQVRGHDRKKAFSAFDLASNTVLLKDPLGQYNLNNLRTWVNTNDDDGTQWAKYTAKDNVQLGDKLLFFDSAKLFSAKATTNVLQVCISGIPAFQITAGASYATNALHIVGFEVDAEPGFSHLWVTTPFDEPVYLKHKENLTDLNWLPLAGTECSSERLTYQRTHLGKVVAEYTAYRVKIPADGDAHSGFYIAAQDLDNSSPTRVDFFIPVYVNGKQVLTEP